MLKPKVTGLVNLENYHNSVQSQPAKERIVVTDGNVTNMNMNPNKTGNRTLFISDINADFDMKAAVIPQHHVGFHHILTLISVLVVM